MKHAWMATLLRICVAGTAACRAKATQPLPAAEEGVTARLVGLPDGAVDARSVSFSGQTPQVGAGCEKINNDPLVTTDGNAMTDDPIVRFRSASYALSFTYRLQGE